MDAGGNGSGLLEPVWGRAGVGILGLVLPLLLSNRIPLRGDIALRAAGVWPSGADLPCPGISPAGKPDRGFLLAGRI